LQLASCQFQTSWRSRDIQIATLPRLPPCYEQLASQPSVDDIGKGLITTTTSSGSNVVIPQWLHSSHPRAKSSSGAATNCLSSAMESGMSQCKRVKTCAPTPWRSATVSFVVLRVLWPSLATFQV
jgi:hypothetical protein